MSSKKRRSKTLWTRCGKKRAAGMGRVTHRCGDQSVKIVGHHMAGVVISHHKCFKKFGHYIWSPRGCCGDQSPRSYQKKMVTTWVMWWSVRQVCEEILSPQLKQQTESNFQGRRSQKLSIYFLSRQLISLWLVSFNKFLFLVEVMCKVKNKNFYFNFLFNLFSNLFCLLLFSSRQFCTSPAMFCWPLSSGAAACQW